MPLFAKAIFCAKKKKKESMFLSLMFDEDLALYNLWGFKNSNVFIGTGRKPRMCVYQIRCQYFN